MFASGYFGFFRDVSGEVKYMSEEEMVTKAGSGSIVFSIFSFLTVNILSYSLLSRQKAWTLSIVLVLILCTVQNSLPCLHPYLVCLFKYR